MEFRDNEAIYLQIAGYVSEKILRQQWPPDDKIPSVRDLAGELQVNPNTVMRTYEFLQNQGVLYNKRGIGFFVAPDAAQHVNQLRRARFLQQEQRREQQFITGFHVRWKLRWEWGKSPVARL